MTKIKLHALTPLIFMYISMLQAQTDSIAYLGKVPDYVKLMNANFNDSISAKEEELNKNKESEINYSGNWIIGAGINIIQDSGTQGLSNLTESKYNYYAIPFTIGTEYLTNSIFSFSATVLINKFQSGKEIQGLTILDVKKPNYFAVDFGTKVFFRKIQTTYKFTPYITVGTGYRYISGYQGLNKSEQLVVVPKTRDITINTGAGASYWMNSNWGLNLNYIGKFALKAGANKNYKTNHLVLSFGAFYRFNNKYFK